MNTFFKFSLCFYKAHSCFARLCCARVLGTVQAKRTLSARHAAIVLTAFLLAGCKENEVTSVPDKGSSDIIRFETTTTLLKATTTVESTLKGDKNGFKVYGTGGKSPTDWIAGIDGTNNHVFDGSEWGWKDEQVWWSFNPAGYPMNFYAWDPADPEGLTVVSEAVGNLAFDFVVPPLLSKQADLVAGRTSAAARPDNGRLPITFNHILSKVNFGVNVATGFTAHIQALGVKNVAGSGTYNVISSSWSNNTTFNASFNCFGDFTSMGNTKDVKTFTGNGTIQSFTGNNVSMMMIPQTPTNDWKPVSKQTPAANATYIQMLYRMTSGSDHVGFASAASHPNFTGGYAGPLFVKVGYPYASKWEKGEGYTYNIRLPGSGGFLVDGFYYDETGKQTTLPIIGGKQPGESLLVFDSPGTWVTDEKMPIMAWWSIPEVSTSLARFQELADAGFTHNLMKYTSQSELQKALDAAHAVGIKMLPITDGIKWEDLGSWVTRFKNHPALWAWSLMDEPYPGDFPNVATSSRMILSYDPNTFCYVNLLPIDQDTAVYRGYVRGAIEQIPNLKFISFDNYPVNQFLGIPYLSPLWEENYRIVAEEAKRAGMPFWAFICSVKWASAQPIPTIHTMRWYAYTALAYGSQGIQYFTYTNYTTPDWTYAPFDFYTQQKTATYYLAQELNKEIQNFAKVFLNARVLEVRHTGTPNDAYQLKKAPAVFKTFETGSSGALTSLLVKDYRMFFVVVNRSVSQNLQVKVEVDNDVLQVTKNGTLKALTGLQTENLTPGDVLIYTWTRLPVVNSQ